MKHIAHWDDVESARRDYGHLRGSWTDLGVASGSVGVGLRRIDIDADGWSTPAHVHGGEEEIFYVLGGSGLSWQDGKTYEIGPGDCLVHLAEEETHTLRAGPDGLDVLAWGTRVPAEACHLPRAGVSWLGPSWTDAGGGEHPYTREAAAGAPEVGEPEAERPQRIVALGDVPERRVERGDTGFGERDFGVAAGSVLTGLSHVEIDSGRSGYPPHCHSAEEEMFVVLDGEGVCVLGDEEHPVRRGHVVARPAATRVAHAFRAGEQGLSLLAYGTREPNDIAYYPRSGKVSLRGVGVMGRIEQLDYWDGEA